jgi:hypothetical protein
VARLFPYLPTGHAQAYRGVLVNVCVILGGGSCDGQKRKPVMRGVLIGVGVMLRGYDDIICALFLLVLSQSGLDHANINCRSKRAGIAL